MNISEAEKLTGVSKKTIRFYEEAGLISIGREERTGYRIFKEEDIDRLKVIKLYRKIGVPIEEIRDDLDRTSPLSEVLVRQIQVLNQQINSLHAKKELLETILEDEKLQENNPELIYDVEDIIYCNPLIIKDKLNKLEKEAIILVSMCASPQVNEFLQGLLPEINIQEEQRKLGRVRIEAVEKAQTELVISINKRD